MLDDDFEGVMEKRFSRFANQQTEETPAAAANEPSAASATPHVFGSVDRQARKDIERKSGATHAQRRRMAERESKPKRDKLVNFKTTMAGHKKLKGLAARAGMSMTETIERALEEFAQRLDAKGG